ncbi:MAG: hypothetical protein RJR37_14230 [Peptococcaceae bacterium MAG4]|nr:hypothetical protein [Peptococcaceae bacterium MAG4]
MSSLIQGESTHQKQLAEALEASIAGLRKEMASLPEEDQGLLEDLDQLEAAICRAESALAQHGEAEALAGRKAALERDFETLDAEVADLEVLVKALGPDGLRRDLLAGILEGFVGRVNDRLGRLTEGAYQVSLAPDMAILCRANGGPLLPLKLLSKSEQLRVGIAVSEALSAAAGLRFLGHVDEAGHVTRRTGTSWPGCSWTRQTSLTRYWSSPLWATCGRKTPACWE